MFGKGLILSATNQVWAIPSTLCPDLLSLPFSLNRHFPTLRRKRLPPRLAQGWAFLAPSVWSTGNRRDTTVIPFRWWALGVKNFTDVFKEPPACPILMISN
jgi:hypothetical protein